MTHPTKWPEGVTADDIRVASACADHLGIRESDLTGSQWSRLAVLLATHRIAGERAGVEKGNQDSARLDWLYQTHAHTLNQHGAANLIRFEWDFTDPDLRAAIDAARKQT